MKSVSYCTVRKLLFILSIMFLVHLITYKKILMSVAIVVIAIMYRKELGWYYNNFYNDTEDKLGVYSEKKLSEFNGIKQNKLYLAVLGIVFDVTEGKKHYQKGAGYHYFVGKDGSRALVTGNFKDESEDKDHVMDLSCNELFTLLHWRNTFKQKYTEVGLLKGRFYHGNGEETVYTNELKSKIKRCEIEKDNAKREELKYPPCNIAWSEDEGTKVWCTTSSGGVKRSWVGVPRQLYSPGTERPRCICWNADAKDTTSNLIKEYENCSNISTVCLVKT